MAGKTLSEDAAKRALKRLYEAYAREIYGLAIEVTVTKDTNSKKERTK